MRIDGETSRLQRATLAETAHRPWPLPRGPWVMAQTWERLLFAHWPVDPDVLARHVPAGLALDVHEGTAWLGITPFVLTGLRPRFSPPLAAFPELNVRTYVTRGGKPGIFFLSLDAANRVAVEGARLLYALPYFNARMRADVDGDAVSYTSRREDARGHPATFGAEYHPIDAPSAAAPGSLESFLAERYCLYATRGSRVLRAEIHHPPWPLQRAAGRIVENSMPPPGLTLPGAEPLLHFAARQDVLVWPPSFA